MSRLTCCRGQNVIWVPSLFLAIQNVHHSLTTHPLSPFSSLFSLHIYDYCRWLIAYLDSAWSLEREKL